MGKYLNPGAIQFIKSINSEIYVDKSGMIDFLNSRINTEQLYIAVSRPRRFGKTMAANMISAYYNKTLDTRQYFEGLNIGHIPPRVLPVNPVKPDSAATELRWDAYLNSFNVLYLNMVTFIKKHSSVDLMISYMENEVCRELKKSFSDLKLCHQAGIL